MIVPKRIILSVKVTNKSGILTCTGGGQGCWWGGYTEGGGAMRQLTKEPLGRDVRQKFIYLSVVGLWKNVEYDLEGTLCECVK